LREPQSGVNAAPAQVGIRNALADRLLEGGYAVGLDLFALRLLGFTLDPEFVLLNHVELRSLRIDGIDHRRRQLDAEYEYVENLDRILQKIVVVFGVRLFRRLGLHQLVEIGTQALLRAGANLGLYRIARGIDLFGRVFGNDFARLAADFGVNDRLQVLRADELVQHGDGAVRQLIPDVYLRGNVHAVLGDGVDRLGRGLQPQIINEQLVPRPNEVQAFLPQLAGIQDSAAVEAPAVEVKIVNALPVVADPAARHRDHHVGPQHDDHQQRHEKRGDHGQKVAPNEAPPAALPQRQPLLLQQVFVPAHQPLSVERGPGLIRCCSAVRPSSMRIRRLAPISAINSRRLIALVPNRYSALYASIFSPRAGNRWAGSLTHPRRGSAHRRQVAKLPELL